MFEWYNQPRSIMFLTYIIHIFLKFWSITTWLHGKDCKRAANKCTRLFFLITLLWVDKARPLSPFIFCGITQRSWTINHLNKTIFTKFTKWLSLQHLSLLVFYVSRPAITNHSTIYAQSSYPLSLVVQL